MSELRDAEDVYKECTLEKYADLGAVIIEADRGTVREVCADIAEDLLIRGEYPHGIRDAIRAAILAGKVALWRGRVSYESLHAGSAPSLSKGEYFRRARAQRAESLKIDKEADD